MTVQPTPADGEDGKRHDYASIGGHMARGAGWMVAMSWSLRCIGLVNTLIIARLLTPDDFGINTMAWIVVEFLMVLAETNVELALLRANRFDRDDLDTAWTIKVISGAFITLGLILVAPLAAAFYGDPRLQLVIQIVALRGVITGFENIGVLEFRHKLQFRKEYRYWVLRRLITLGLGLALVLTLGNYMALACAGVLSGVVMVAVSYGMSPYRPRFSLARGRELWSFSQWLILFNVARYINSRLDQFLIGRISGAGATGSYYVAADLASMPIREVVQPMGRAFTPTLAKIAHDRDEMRKALRGILSYVSIFVLAAGVGMSAVAEDAVMVLLGDQWPQSVGFFRWLAIYGIFEGFFLALEPYFITRKTERGFALVNVLQLAVLLPALLLAAEAHGVEAIAIARALIMAATVSVLVAAVLAKGWLGPSDLLAVLWRPVLAAAAMGLAVDAVRLGAGAGHLLSLLVDVVVGAAVFTLGLLALWLAAGRPEGPERTVLAALRARIPDQWHRRQ